MADSSVTFRDLLRGTAQALPTTASPNDPSVNRALVLAAHAATATADGPAIQDWAAYGDALQHAIDVLHPDMNGEGTFVDDLPVAGPDKIELRCAAVELVRHLADLHATAAADAIDCSEQGAIWSQVAHYLADAAAELGFAFA
ncbi:hypothetical protein AB0M46_00260 [Dactylosporangium sp. NPDC051485]|uniref:hypothetical protein n=1 Tax=Dactylosporangium sp. NPDC051485 TaxID=3154846 RepID=UPI00342F59B4